MRFVVRITSVELLSFWYLADSTPLRLFLAPPRDTQNGRRWGEARGGADHQGGATEAPQGSARHRRLHYSGVTRPASSVSHWRHKLGRGIP